MDLKFGPGRILFELGALLRDHMRALAKRNLVELNGAHNQIHISSRVSDAVFLLYRLCQADSDRRPEFNREKVMAARKLLGDFFTAFDPEGEKPTYPAADELYLAAVEAIRATWPSEEGANNA